MTSVILTSFMLKLFTAVLAYLVIRIVLRRFDKAAHFSFERWLRKADEKHVSYYLCARVIGICYLFAAILSS